jgi:hypothetical protein
VHGTLHAGFWADHAEQNQYNGFDVTNVVLPFLAQ